MNKDQVSILMNHENKISKYCTIDSFGLMNKEMKFIRNLQKISENDKFKTECQEIENEEKSIILNSWKGNCNNYDFLLTYSCMFTIHTFETLSHLIYITGRSKRSTRWGVGKRIYAVMRNNTVLEKLL